MTRTKSVKHHIYAGNQIDKLRSQYKDYYFFDLYKAMWIEKFLVENAGIYFLPELERNAKAEEAYTTAINKGTDKELGNWIALPSKKEVYHLLDQEEFLKLRTARNRNLVTEEEQLKLYDKKIVLAGLSVGSNILLSFIRYGIGNQYLIADMDTVATHNINRAQYFLRDHGKEKLDVVTDQALSIDPYLAIEGWNVALTTDNIEHFIQEADLIVDAFDDFKTKIALRAAAKKYKKPVLSGFDIHRGAMVIVERYDTEPDLDIDFYLNGFSVEEISKPVQKPEDKTNLFINIIGREYHDERMLESVLSVGKKLTSYPQLIVATSIASAEWTIAASDLLLGKNTGSFRKYINVGELMYTPE